MSRNRFVQPETVRLEISDGDWIEVKKRLTYGEEQRLAGAALGKVSQLEKGADAEIGMDLERFQVERLFTWLVDWSFRDASDRPVRLSKDAIRALDPDTVVEIDAALDRHIEYLAMEKKAAKMMTASMPR